MENETKKTFGIIAKIKRLLDIGDDAHLHNFFVKVNKQLLNEIESLKHNVKTLTLNHEKNISDLKEELEDAVVSLDSCWSQVDLASITTNNDQKAYISQYFERIENATDVKEKIEILIKETTKAFGEQVAKINEQIKEREFRIAEITKERN